MRSVGNCGNGEVGAINEPREAAPHVRRFAEIAWHRGATASATGTEAMRRQRAKALEQERDSPAGSGVSA